MQNDYEQATSIDHLVRSAITTNQSNGDKLDREEEKLNLYIITNADKVDRKIQKSNLNTNTKGYK